MELKQYEIEVLVNGKPVDEYLHEGKTFIEGKEGTEFALRLRNRTGKRALFVPTIDGLSVMDGKEASFNSSGYIVNAYSTDTIDGWRTSDDKVAKFFFSAIKESYAAKTGKSGNQGVIGCAVFAEKEPKIEIRTIVVEKIVEKPYPVYPHWTYNWPHSNIFYCSTGGQVNSLSASHTTASSGPALTVNMASSNIGTGFGDEKYSPVVSVSFDREKDPVAVFTIFYNTRKNLEAMGVTFKKPLQVSAFPKESRYCVPPQN